jgi:hypothetical protein
VRRITRRAELVELARELGVRPNWHEPDEQELCVTVEGTIFDNAGFWPGADCSADASVEQHVTLWHGDFDATGRQRVEALACVNLATLFAWATGYELDQSVTEAARVTAVERLAAQRVEDERRLVRDEYESRLVRATVTALAAVEAREMVRAAAITATAVDDALRAGQEHWELEAEHATTTTLRSVALLIAEAFHQRRVNTEETFDDR